GRVVSNFITQAIANAPITVHGDGQQTRSFCYVSDLVSGLIALMASSQETIGPINIGNPDEISMIELAQKIKRQCQSTSEIVLAGRPKDDPSRRCPDIKKAKKELAWSPKVSLEDGLDKSIQYFQTQLSTGVID
ncbi:MAG: NAD-dependent dehydratase, partial [Actinobacteria bacterium]|nr:NAD-dependent dehydratase [Actinomycetota bacterium]